MEKKPPRHNLQQSWPEAERAWLRETAKSLGVSEKEYLLALIRREGHRGEEIDVPVADYLRTPNRRTARARAKRVAARRAATGEAT